MEHLQANPTPRPGIAENLCTRLGVIALCLVVGACVSDDPTSPSGQGGVAVPGVWAFAPTNLRVHPLTHVETDVKGRPILIAHVELRDRWSDSTKGIGKLTIRVFGPSNGALGGPDREVCRWDADLTDLDTNASLFDPATRTYRIQLVDGPAWLAGLAIGGSAATAAPGVAKVTVQAALDPGASSGLGAKPLSDEHIVQR